MFNFLSAKETIKSASTQYRALMSELHQTEAEIAATLTATTNRKDVCELAVNWVERAKAGFAPALADRMRNVFSHGLIAPFDFGFFSVMKNESGDVTTVTMDQAMCSLFSAEIKKALCDAINKMDWPNEGLARAERAAKVEKLRAHEKEIRTELTELQKQADEAGFELA